MTAVPLRVIDWAPGEWFLLETSNGEIVLDARYSYSAIVDDSALLKFDSDELRGWRAEGRAFVTDLAQNVSDQYVTLRSEPQVYSRWWQRDLYRSDDGARWRSEVSDAIHDWPAWVAWRAKQ